MSNKKSYSKAQRKMIAAGKRLSIALFAVVLCAGLLTGLLFFARPSESAVEKRQLTTFPAFTVSSFLDGSWFSGISTWYADTFPGRERLMSASLAMKDMYGIKGSESFYGGGHADAIPDQNQKNGKESKTKANQKPAERKYTSQEIPDTFALTDSVQSQVMQGLLVKDGAVYGAYYFIQETADAYIDTLNRAAEELEGITNVYCILIPNNSGVVLDEQTMQGLGGSDPLQASAYYCGGFNDLVHPVPIIEALRDHKNEYVYFRTDHHWTGLGAYYAYVEFCKAKGVEPASLDSFETHTYEPFLGSYVTELQRYDLNADSVTGYVPNDTNSLTVYTGDYEGNTTFDTENMDSFEAPVFNTANDLDEYSQYLRFISGDRGLITIDNPKLNDGSSCMIIKESYGNALVPFLVDHYDKIYVVDERYNNGQALSFCKENQVDDLIIASNMQIAASTAIPPVLDALLR